MDVLASALLVAFTAASNVLSSAGQGAAEAAGTDAGKRLMAKMSGLMHMDEQRRAIAFDAAVRAALMRFRQSSADPNSERTLLLLADDSPEGRQFRQMAIEELVLKARPNIGCLLDYYRRNIRFVALLRNEQLPDWPEIEPTLRLLLGVLLPQALADQPELRPLMLEQAELSMLDSLHVIERNTAATSAALERVEALIGAIVDAPETLQQLRSLPGQSISAEDGSTISNVQQIIVLGNYFSTPLLPAPDLKKLFATYRTFIVETYRQLDFRGIRQMQNVVRLRLDDIYIPLTGQQDLFVAVRSRYQDEQSQTTLTKLEQQVHPPPQTPLHEIVRDTPFLVVLGDPGAGKSTLVRYLMLALAEGMAGQRLGLAEEWLPIMFPVAAFAEARAETGHHDIPPLDYLTTYYLGLSQPDYGPLFRHALLSGRALVLFDGLDEVRDGRAELVGSLTSFVRIWALHGNRFIATSRSAGYDDAPLDADLFTRVTVLPFSDDDIKLFIRRWSYAFESTSATPSNIPVDPAAAEAELTRRAAERAVDITAAVFSNDNVTDLARNPLLLTILALIHHQGARLPDRRVDLYRLCVEALAETWNQARSLTGRPIDVYLGDDKLDERFVVNLLGPAALWIHEETPAGMALIEQDDLERKIAATLVQIEALPPGRAQRLANDFIELVRVHTGLLQERGYRRFSFLHLTFEEYLAARALLDSAVIEDPDDLILTHCTEPGWREVIRLAAAAATPRAATRLLLHLLDAPTGPATHGRPVVLAGECLIDISRTGSTRKTWDVVIERLLQLLADPQVPFGIRVEGGSVLGRLGDPRLLALAEAQASPAEAAMPEQGYWCPISAGAFWYGDDRDEALQNVALDYDYLIARYAVTNAEYQRFMKAQGYQNTELWTIEGRRWLAQADAHTPRWFDDPRFNNLSQPVVGVSWYEALAYCRWLTGCGRSAGWLGSTEVIRLPTSLEWERAARHTDRRRYPWGAAMPDAERTNYQATALGVPAPVGCFPGGQAACGAHDMVGNTMEWMATLNDAPLARAPVTDAKSEQRMLVAYNDFQDAAEQLCCGARDRAYPILRYFNQGFRIVRAPIQ